MAIEIFTTYTPVDPNSKLTIIASKITGVNVDRDETIYVYKDKGVDHFDALDIDFEIYIASTSLDYSHGGMGITNTLGSRSDFAITDLCVRTYRSDIDYTLELIRGDGVAFDQYVCSADTVYYCTLERVAGNDSVHLKIYSDSERTNELDDLVVAGFGTLKWRYCDGFVNLNSGHSGRDWDGYIANMDLKEVPVGWTGKISGVTNPAKIMGVDVANIKSVKGVE